MTTGRAEIGALSATRASASGSCAGASALPEAPYADNRVTPAVREGWVD